jgi:hypothetical protein
LINSHIHIILSIQMVRLKVSRGNEEPSTQRRTKARHDPAAFRAVQEVLGQKGSQRSSTPRRCDPPPSYAEGSEEEIVEEEEGTESDDDVEDETYEQSPEPPRRHEKKDPATSPIPKGVIKPPISTKAAQLLEFLLNISKE